MAATLDARRAKSRAALLSAITTLLDAPEWQAHAEHSETPDPSASDVARLAGVSRPTLYHHFDSLAALVRTAALTRIEQAVPHGVVEPVRTKQERLIAHLATHAAFYRRVIRLGEYEFQREAIELLTQRLIRDSDTAAAITAHDPDTAPRTIEALAAAYVWLLFDWVVTGCKASPDEILATMHRFAVTFGRA